MLKTKSLKAIIVLFCSLIFSSFLLKEHPFHVSNCEITFNTQSQKFQIAQKIFIDDLENGLKDWGIKDLYIGTPKQKNDALAQIEKYLKNKLLLEVDKQKIDFHCIGSEISKDYMAIWIYAESNPIALPQSLTITNNILLDKFYDQKNIVSIEIPNGKNAYLLLQNGSNSKTVPLK